jgi:hypothetical protein
MSGTNLFLIESERDRHRLSLNGRELLTFTTLAEAEAEAGKIGAYIIPGSTLRFGLDFKWTLSDLEVRTATLQLEGEKKEQQSCGS